MTGKSVWKRLRKYLREYGVPISKVELDQNYGWIIFPWTNTYLEVERYVHLHGAVTIWENTKREMGILSVPWDVYSDDDIHDFAVAIMFDYRDSKKVEP